MTNGIGGGPLENHGMVQLSLWGLDKWNCPLPKVGLLSTDSVRGKIVFDGLVEDSSTWGTSTPFTPNKHPRVHGVPMKVSFSYGLKHHLFGSIYVSFASCTGCTFVSTRFGPAFNRRTPPILWIRSRE